MKNPILTFSPTAWAKILYFREKADGGEISGYGYSDKGDLLHVLEFHSIKQEMTGGGFDWVDDDVGRYFDEQVLLSRVPVEFARIWIHTHPGESTAPSSTDAKTFKESFGRCDWALMCIIGTDNSIGAYLKYNTAPPLWGSLDGYLDYTKAFEASDFESWEKEFDANIHKPKPVARVYTYANARAWKNRKQVNPPVHVVGDEDTTGTTKPTKAIVHRAGDEIMQDPRLWDEGVYYNCCRCGEQYLTTYDDANILCFECRGQAHLALEKLISDGVTPEDAQEALEIALDAHSPVTDLAVGTAVKTVEDEAEDMPDPEKDIAEEPEPQDKKGVA